MTLHQVHVGASAPAPPDVRQNQAIAAQNALSDPAVVLPQQAEPVITVRSNLDEIEWRFDKTTRQLDGRAFRWVGPVLSFLLVVVVPFAAVIMYLFHYAAPQYISEFRFSVTEVSGSNSSSLGGLGGSGGASAAMSVASSLLGGSAPQSGSQQNFVVVDYIRSRQAVDEVLKHVDLREVYARPESDWWARLPPNVSRDKLVDYWRKMVVTDYDPMTGLARAEVRTFEPEDSYRIARLLVEISETLVNTIARRSRADVVLFAERELKDAREKLEKARVDLATYRVREGVIDPTQSVVSSNVAVGATLRNTLSSLQTEIGTLQSQSLSQDSPVIQSLRARIKATTDELKKVQQEVASTREGRESLERVVAEYERLDVERQYAQARVVSAAQTLDQAKASAASQHLYLTPYVQPAIPDSPKGPNKANILTMAGLALMALWIVSLLMVRSIRQSLA